MNTKAVIFDLDGTLLNTLEDLTDSVNYVLMKYNYPLNSLTQVKNSIGNGSAKLIERVIPEGINNPNFTDCHELFKYHYVNNMFNKTKPYDGIIKMLSDIKDIGIKTAVVSNKYDYAVKNLCVKYLNNFIDYAQGEDIINGLNKKPSSDMLIKVLDELKINKENAILVGDSEVDIQTARNFNIPCISVLWGYKDKEFLLQNGAKILISKPSEILKYF